jgi:hypothetical protein
MEDNNEIQPHFSNSNCDTCGAYGPTVVHYHNGAPVLAQCKTCMPSSHEQTARRDIDTWLNGGSASVFGR